MPACECFLHVQRVSLTHTHARSTADRRSVSVPPRPQSTKFSTFDDPSLVSTQPATPVYGRHTGLEGFVPEGFSHTPVANRAGIGRSSATTELIQQLEQVKMEHQGAFCLFCLLLLGLLLTVGVVLQRELVQVNLRSS
jgi:hypothetical protein